MRRCNLTASDRLQTTNKMFEELIFLSADFFVAADATAAAATNK